MTLENWCGAQALALPTLHALTPPGGVLQPQSPAGAHAELCRVGVTRVQSQSRAL